MQVAAAHSRRLHLDHHLVWSRRRIIELHELELASAREDHATHSRLLSLTSDASRRIKLDPL
jgi:hypothetical protein